MKWTSITAIFFLFWSLSLFLVLPFGVRTTDEAGENRVPGQADSAPGNFSFGRIAVRATVVALVLFAIYYLNYVEGWVTPQMLDVSRLRPQ